MENILYIPPINLRIEIRKDLEKKLRSVFAAGSYTQKEEIVEILNFIHDYHYNKICDIIRGINSKNLISFLLFQFELIENEENLIKSQSIDPIEFKEIILLLCDLIVEKKTYESSNALYFYEEEFLGRLWIHAEKVFEYANASNFTHRVNNTNLLLTIYPVGQQYFLEQNSIPDFNESFKEFQKSIKKNISLRERYLKNDNLQNFIFKNIKNTINQKFKDEFGLSYLEFEFIVLDMIINSKKIKRPNDIPCISNSLIKEFSRQIGIDVSILEQYFNGITLYKDLFTVKGREVWNYTQQERSRKRPLLEINYNRVTWRLFSPKMLGSRIISIEEDMVLSPLNRIPKEWVTKKIKIEFSRANTEIGNWFEKKTLELLREINIFGFKPKTKLRISDGQIIFIDNKTGPPDFIGFSEKDNAIVIIECKLLDCIFEPKGIQSELSKFLDGDKSYICKFENKINWVKKNFESVKKILKQNLPLSYLENCSSIKYCFVTYYPTILKYFYTDIPSPTIFELLELYNENGGWPFERGTLNVK